MSIEAMRQALEALEQINQLSIGENAIALPGEIDAAMDNLRAAIEQPLKINPADCHIRVGEISEPISVGGKEPYDSAPIKQEPVAWMVYGLDGKSVCVTDNPTDFAESQRVLPLYTAPRHWVSLTDWDIRQITGWFGEITGFTRQLFDQIDARLKEKNHG